MVTSLNYWNSSQRFVEQLILSFLGFYFKLFFLNFLFFFYHSNIFIFFNQKTFLHFLRIKFLKKSNFFFLLFKNKRNRIKKTLHLKPHQVLYWTWKKNKHNHNLSFLYDILNSVIQTVWFTFIGKFLPIRRTDESRLKILFKNHLEMKIRPGARW